MRAGLLLSGWYWQSAQHRLAAAAADSAMAIASTGEGDLTKALGLYRRGIILQAVGAYREAVKVLREAIALLDRRGEPVAFAFGGYPFVFCHSFVASSLAKLGKDDIAEELGMRPEVELVALGLARIKGRARRMG